MDISNINSYSNTKYLLGQLWNSSTDSQANTLYNNKSTSSSSESTSGVKTLSEQISSLIRLTRYAMDSMGLSKDERVTFSQLEKYRESVEESFSSAVKEGLEQASVNLDELTFSLSNGNLTAYGKSSLNAALANLAIDSSEGQAVELSAALASLGVNPDVPFTFSLSEEGVVTPIGDSRSWQEILEGNEVSLPVLAGNMASMHIDPKINFTLEIKDDDSLGVHADDSRYESVLQSFFAENPEIVADYKRSEALSGIDEARKYLSLSPSESRTRLQIESIAGWWDTSRQNESSFFTSYAQGLVTRKTGININV